MKELEIKLKNETGLHARPASLLVKAVIEFESSISIEKDSKDYNAKSMMSILSMGADQGSILKFKIDGIDELEALITIEKLFNDGFEQ